MGELIVRADHTGMRALDAPPACNAHLTGCAGAAGRCGAWALYAGACPQHLGEWLLPPCTPCRSFPFCGGGGGGGPRPCCNSPRPCSLLQAGWRRARWPTTMPCGWCPRQPGSATSLRSRRHCWRQVRCAPLMSGLCMTNLLPQRHNSLVCIAMWVRGCMPAPLLWCTLCRLFTLRGTQQHGEQRQWFPGSPLPAVTQRAERSAPRNGSQVLAPLPTALRDRAVQASC